jgi:hypothetical protein
VLRLILVWANAVIQCSLSIRCPCQPARKTVTVERHRSAPPNANREVVMDHKEPTRGPASPITWDVVRQLAITLPEVDEGTSYATPALRVGDKLYVRWHQSGEALVIRIKNDERKRRMKANPRAFYMTDHYVGSPFMLVRLSEVQHDDLRDLLESAWRLSAPKRLIAAFDAR